MLDEPWVRWSALLAQLLVHSLLGQSLVIVSVGLVLVRWCAAKGASRSERWSLVFAQQVQRA